MSSQRPTSVALYIDPPSRSFLRDAFFNQDGAAHAGDQILAPYVYLRSHLNALDIPVHTADYLPPESAGVRNVYVSIGNTAHYKAIGRRGDTILSAFFAMECPTVEPRMYREMLEAQRHFKRIFSWSVASSLEPFVGGPLRCESFRWPQSFESVHEGIWSRTDRGFLVMINGNKYPRFRSPCRELYSERLKAVEYFSRTEEIDLYGFGWDAPIMLVGHASIPGSFGRLWMPATVQPPVMTFGPDEFGQYRLGIPLASRAAAVFRSDSMLALTPSACVLGVCVPASTYETVHPPFHALPTRVTVTSALRFTASLRANTSVVTRSFVAVLMRCERTRFSKDGAASIAITATNAATVINSISVKPLAGCAGQQFGALTRICMDADQLHLSDGVLVPRLSSVSVTSVAFWESEKRCGRHLR